MKRLLDLPAKLLLLIVLVLAVMPAPAVETVCVLAGGKVVRPVEKCAMPCCRKAAAPVKRNCCAPRSVGSARGDRCASLGLGCHCETRLVQPSVSAITDPEKATHPVKAPVAVWSVPFELDLAVHRVSEPGVVGIDSGPPPRGATLSHRSRAPPVLIEFSF